MNMEWVKRKGLIGGQIEVRSDNGRYIGIIKSLNFDGRTLEVKIVDVVVISDRGTQNLSSRVAYFLTEDFRVETPSDGRVIIWRDQGGITIRSRK